MKVSKSLLALIVSLSLVGTASATTLNNVNVGPMSISSNGLSFNKIVLDIKQQGSIEFYPSNPISITSTVNKPQLPENNTVGTLKKELVSLINQSIKSSLLNNYLPITPSNIDVYGGPFLNTNNSFTDEKILAAKPNGEPYRVKITLSPKNDKDVVQKIIEGNFTIYTK
ncbi:hypothetical protein [Photobacterium damselae]|uniref:Uncharacterized protein n=1 Tax=Photobacterium damselae TaxID=38293 RepID=A0ABD6XA18_PHODM|nr:hypothetical protein [Photobacterium damselae]EJN6959190.1 hypothetical protein [Photobacterium damselae]MCG3845943.1 hypothetical protein [Photobacterium damselae]OBU43959.1 hypothetical protein AYY27_05065 [Photobacterium damselae]PSU18852.1 hypothetical protein CTM90_02420 [Photobacterium damselae]UJZ95849.1 hypothetical protein IHC87_20670 [Photobacterium damselae subsp. damselae]